MSFVTTQPESLSSAATTLGGIGSSFGGASGFLRLLQSLQPLSRWIPGSALVHLAEPVLRPRRSQVKGRA